jgi:hypothetical protein
MILMLGGVLDDFLKIIKYVYLYFIRASLINNMLYRYFLNYL